MNYRQAKKKMNHQTMKRGGWKAYKDLMKKSGFWSLNCVSQINVRNKNMNLRSWCCKSREFRYVTLDD